MIYVKSQIKFTSGLNPKCIISGFSVVKNVGRLFLIIMIIHMVAQEIQKDKKYFNIHEFFMMNPITKLVPLKITIN